MKKSHLYSIVLATFMLTAFIGSSQVANYNFTETTGSYQTIIGDPTIATWSGTISGSSTNRQTFNVPFDFCVGGTNWNAGSQLTMYHDGWARFGTPVSVNSTTITQPLSNFTNVLSAFGTNLITTGTSSYGARVEGSSPNRVLVLQWGQMYFGDSYQSPFITTNYWKRATNGHSNDRLHFQIRLYETTNVIEFCYLISNPRTSSSGSLTSDVQVGLTGIIMSDFNVRRHTSANTPWNGNTVAAGGLPSGTSNTMHFNNQKNNANNKPAFVIPANPGNNSTKAGPGVGTIFRWSPIYQPTPSDPSSGCFYPLPVELSDFSAHKEDRKNKISWTTVTETNSDYFVVERSLNGGKWDEVGTVPSAGNSSTAINYSLMDNSFEPTINYYRLKQVDLDGKVKYYNIISVDNRASKKDLVKTVNIMGQEVDKFYKGLVIEMYSDGTSQKIYR